MAKFCTYCGTPLNEGQTCDCPKSVEARKAAEAKKDAEAKAAEGFSFEKLFVKIKDQMGINDGSSDSSNVYEHNESIVPENIRPTENEVPVKQYNIALLRSRIRCQRAEGRLQVTNKRLIFRATGISLKGKNTIQNEFLLDEIAGIEIRESNRISFLNIVLSLFLTTFLMVMVGDTFTELYYKSEFLASVLTLLIAVISIGLFFFAKRKFWLKLVVNSLGVGIVSSMIDVDLYSILMKEKVFTFYNTVFFVLALVWVFNVIIVTLVPDLIINIKTKSASDAIQIRRKKLFSFVGEPHEYTGFSEVLPGMDTHLATKEIGALINDIQMFGDSAIEVWKK